MLSENHPTSFFSIENFLTFNTVTGRLLLFIFYSSAIAITIFIILHAPVYAIGDEKFYIFSAKSLIKNTLYYELSIGNPLGYTYLLYLVSQTGIGYLYAGYIITLISSVALFSGIMIILKKTFGLKEAYLHLSAITILFAMLIGNIICIASDDMYYSAIFIWIIIYLAEAVQKNKSWKYFALIGAIMSLTLLIRPLTYLYFAGSIISFLIISLASKDLYLKNILRISAFASAFIIMFTVQQYPSIKERGKIAFENKISDTLKTKANWTQKNTLTTIILAKGGTLEEDNKRASWKQCDEYLSKYGNDALPQNSFSRLIWNPLFVLKYALIGFLKIADTYFMHTGFAFVLPILFLFRPKDKYYKKYAFITVLMISSLLIYLFEALNHIENRHLILPHILLSICGVYYLQKLKTEGNKYADILAFLQLFAMFIIMISSCKFFFLHPAGAVFYN